MIDQAGIRMAQGSAIACERIQGVNDNMTQSHYHDYFELYYLETGERFHMVGDRVYRNQPGEFFLFSPYTMHHSFGEADVAFKRLVLYFRGEAAASGELRAALENGTGLYQPDPAARQLLHRILQDILKEQESPSPFSGEYQNTLLNLLLLSIVRGLKAPKQPEKRDRIQDIIQHIHLHYMEDLTLEDLARQFYVSPYHLCREFKRRTGRTLTQYINVTRIMNAQRKLMETDWPVTEISDAAGFSSITHFNRVFKRIAGVTPSQYRNGKAASTPAPPAPAPAPAASSGTPRRGG